MTADEQRIREFAYQIWESEGRPHGQDARHWEMARKLAEAESQPAEQPAGKVRRVSKPKTTTTTTATPAATKATRTTKATSIAKPAKATDAATSVKKPRTPRAPKPAS